MEPMKTAMPFLRTTLYLSYETAIEQLTAALKEQGLSILFHIDVSEILRQTLGIDTDRYLILGAGNAVLTYLALQAEPDIGLLFLCSVVVQEDTAQGRTQVAVLPPDIMVHVTQNSALQSIADESMFRLQQAIDAL